MRHARWGWLAGLLIGLVGTGLPGAAGAQPATDTLRVSATSPNGSATAPVTQAQIRFSEPMVALADAAVVDRVDYIRVEPEMPLGFRWADTNVLVIQPTERPLPAREPHHDPCRRGRGRRLGPTARRARQLHLRDAGAAAAA